MSEQNQNQKNGAVAKPLVNFECIAHIDEFVARCAPLKVGDVIGEIAGKPIYVIGRFVGKSSGWLPPSVAVRWNVAKDDSSRGFFSRGLACYLSRCPAWVNDLPRVK